MIHVNAVTNLITGHQLVSGFSAACSRLYSGKDHVFGRNSTLHLCSTTVSVSLAPTAAGGNGLEEYNYLEENRFIEPNELCLLGAAIVCILLQPHSSADLQ